MGDGPQIGAEGIVPEQQQPSLLQSGRTSFSSFSLLALHEICPNITSIESNSLDRAALSEEVLQALRWQVKRFVSMDRLRPLNQLGMLQSFGPTLVELRFDYKCSYTLSEDDLIAVAAHCPHLRVFETKLPLQQQEDSIAFNQCCCAHIDGLPILSFLLSRLRECEELVLGLQCSSITDLWSTVHLSPSSDDDDRCRLKRIAFPDWRSSAGTEDSCQRMFIALIAAFPQLQYVRVGDDFRWDLLQQEMRLLELSPPDEEDVWDALLSKCKGITSLRICTPWETPVSALSLQQQVPVLPLLQQMGARLLALHLRGIVAISAVLGFLPHCPALEALSIDFIGVQEGSFLETIASCCRLRQLHVLKEKRVHVTDDLMVALFAGCPQLKDLLIIGAPQLSYAALQGIVDRRLLLHKISLGPRVGISRDDVERFREQARSAQLLPVPVVEFVK